MKTDPKYLAGSPLATDNQRDLEKERVDYFNNAVGSVSDKLNSLARFISRQNFAKYFCYYEIFRKTQGTLGSILECGVYYGNGLMTYANLAAALEPYNYQCKIIGFDTFAGDRGVQEIDSANPLFRREEKDFYAESYQDLQRAIAIYDRDRPLNHLPKVELVKGDLCATAANFVANNQSLTIRILHLSVNLYAPTRAALQAFLPRISRGGAVVIHGLNYTATGASQALFEQFSDWRQLKLQTFDFYPNICYYLVD